MTDAKKMTDNELMHTLAIAHATGKPDSLTVVIGRKEHERLKECEENLASKNAVIAAKDAEIERLKARVESRSVVMRLCPDCHEALHSIELGEEPTNDQPA